MKGNVLNPLSESLWIASSYPCASPIFTRSFTVDSLSENAVLYVTGLGYFEVYINGIQLGNDLFIPPASDYFRRDFSNVTYPVRDFFTHRIYYHVFDITKYIKHGSNSLEIQCGGGWFVQPERLAEGNMSYSDRPQCIYSIKLGNSIFNSDGSEVWHESEIRESLLFLGEVIDANYTDSDDKPVITLNSPDSVLTEADGVPDRVIRDIKPVLVSEKDGIRIYDAKENISGIASLTTHAEKGAEYVLRFSEVLDSDGNPDFSSTGSGYIGASGRKQIMCDRFVTDGNKRTFIPKFVWHAFRYIEVTGDFYALDSITVHVIHADVPLTCQFESDSEGLNFLFDAYVRTQLSNYHGSFPSDCPHRERLGYTGDGQICAQTAMMMFDSKLLYRKWIRDITDSQDLTTGHIQHTAPFGGGGGGPGGWCTAVITVPYAYYKQYGDYEIVKENIGAMKRFIEFTASCIEDGLVVCESEGGWCLGDWCMLESGRIPDPFVNTCWFIHALRLYIEMKENVYGCRDEDAAELEVLCLEAVKKQYSDIKHIGAANAYAAWIGIDNIDKCADYYDYLGAFDTGFLGTDILCDILFGNGRGDVAYKLLSSEKAGSYLYMKRSGATTIWERWLPGGSSKSHPMFGACCRQLFEGILGIRQNDASIAYESLTICPYLPDGMNFVRGSVMTAKGRIGLSLERCGSSVTVKTDIPSGVNAVLKFDNTEQTLKCGSAVYIFR